MDGQSRWTEYFKMFLETLENKLQHYGLSQAEYELICKKLNRQPQGVEWALFSALWSEHCSYKSSKKHLKKLLFKTPSVLHGFGENAGVVDLGQGERVAFKIESHNHPSLIDPYQGAATGVGGILRDIFTMGARPIALANYLCFGDLLLPKTQRLLDGVVRGIGDYGNCVGVPMLTGQTEFDSGYNHNIVVNALALGYFGKQDKVFLSQAKNEGDLVVYVGAKTGRDGIHGASMASKPSDKNINNRPSVQIGDPFFEKLLIESCLEAMKNNLIEAIQDMGASGLTSSSFEMASKGQVGMKLYLDQVPLRDSTLTPEDILLSESQERMLVICKPNNLQKLKNIFTKWDLEAQQIGHTIKERQVYLYWHNQQITKIDPDTLVKNAPEYNRPYNKRAKSKKYDFLKSPQKNEKSIWDRLSCMQGRSKRWIFQQYDQRVGAKTQRDCDHSIGVLKLPESQRDLGVVLGGRPHLMQKNAFIGGQDSVLYPAIELAIKGFKPIAVTNCLNFGNPQKTDIMTQFVDTIDGMNEACRALKTPIVSGNVSFYNESQNKNIIPTPAIGMIGLRDSLLTIPGDKIKEEKHAVLLLEMPNNNIKALSQWIFDLQDLCSSDMIIASRIVGKGGIGYTLCRLCCGPSCAGIKLLNDIPDLFSEKLYQVILVVDALHVDYITKSFTSRELMSTFLGQTEGNMIKNDKICWNLDQIYKTYESQWDIDGL